MKYINNIRFMRSHHVCRISQPMKLYTPQMYLIVQQL